MLSTKVNLKEHRYHTFWPVKSAISRPMVSSNIIKYLLKLEVSSLLQHLKYTDLESGVREVTMDTT